MQFNHGRHLETKQKNENDFYSFLKQCGSNDKPKLDKKMPRGYKRSWKDAQFVRCGHSFQKRVFKIIDGYFNLKANTGKSPKKVKRKGPNGINVISNRERRKHQVLTSEHFIN